MRLLICAGGTGGGVYPALSILQALAEQALAEQALAPTLSPEEPSEGDLQVLWVGGEAGMEADLVKRAGVPFEAIPAAGVHGVGLRALPGNLLQLGRGFRAAQRVLARFRPDVVLFTGGYVAVPMALAARISISKKRPHSLVYIPDVEPGLALKVLLRFADHAAVTTEESRSYLPGRIPATVTGYPVRRELSQWTVQASARQALHLEGNEPVLLVMGGSTGARSINRAVLAVLPELLSITQMIHLTGQRDWAEVDQARQALAPAQSSRYHAYPYLYDEIGPAMAAADLALSRAGASCLGEYPLFGLPSILVPYPYAWRYQRVNAEHLVQRGAALMVLDENLPDQILPVVRSLLQDRPRLAAMRQAMLSLSRPQAAHGIANLLHELSVEGDPG